MSQDSPTDFTVVLLGVEERITERIRQQFVVISDRLDVVLSRITAKPLLAAGNQAGLMQPIEVDTVASPPVLQTPDGTLLWDAGAGATQDDVLTALTVAVSSAEVLADVSSGIATQEALATHPAHRALQDQRQGFDPGEQAGEEGVTFAARLAREAVLALGEQLEREGVDVEKLHKLDRACRHLQPPLTAQPVAKAYDFVREIRKGCGITCEELGKFAALAVRDTLVLHICCSVGSMSDIGFDSALENAFERQLSPELRSQLHLARSAICRLGQDFTLFERVAPNIFSSQLTQEELNALFRAYSACNRLVASASGTPKASQQAKRRPKKSQKVQAAEGVARVDALLQETEHEDNQAMSQQHALEPCRLQPSLEPQWLKFQGDMGHVICQAQSSWEGGVPFHEMDPWPVVASGDAWPSGYFNFEAEEPLKVAEQVKPLQWLVSDHCYKCSSKDTYSWACIDGLFYCDRCWGAQLHGRLKTQRRGSADAILIPVFGQLHVLKATTLERHDPGGPPERFAHIDHVALNQHQPTQVVILDAGMLEVAAQAGQNAVLLWSGENTVSHASTFRMALEASWPETEIVSSQFGGVYVPEVMVYMYSDGREIKPFRMAMVYAAPSALAAPAMSEEELQQYLYYMKEEILNMLRMCSFKGHDEIVLGAWGCDGASPCAAAIAELFYDALLVNSDVARSFRRVTFAISRTSSENRTLDEFRRRFDNSRQ